MTKYKYYFRKPKSEIVKDIFTWILLAGAITIAASSPSFGISAWRAFQKWQKQKRYQKQKFSDTFTRLKRRGLLRLERDRHDLRILLTEEARRLAGYMQIDRLTIIRPKKWDGKWRIVVFDIPQVKLPHRNAFRGKLRELGFLPFQKSVWIHPFDCRAEIAILKDFFGLQDKEVKVIVAQDIGDQGYFKKQFKLS